MIIEGRKVFMIAAKTYDEILSMTSWERYLWYKTILLKEKKDAKQILETVRRTKISKTMMGKVCSKETRTKMSVSKIGEKNPAKRMEVRNRMSTSHKGKIVTEETRVKMSKSHTGKKHYMYGRGRNRR